jgi:hypothetical protein
MKKLQHLFAATLALIGSAVALHAQSVSVNFTGNGNGGIDNSQSTSLINLVMDPTGATVETAGAPGFATTNWNNFDRYGSQTSGIIDYTGADSGLAMQWDSAGSYSGGAYGSYGTPDSKLMDGGNEADWGGGPAGAWTSAAVYWAGGNDKPAVYIGGIQSWLAAHGGATSYSVVLYVQGWHGWWGTSEHWVQAVTNGSATSYNMQVGNDLTPHLFCKDTGEFNGTYTQVASTCTNSGAASGGGNYIVFNSLTNDAILLRTSETFGDWQSGKLLGFQIVATPATPVTSLPVFSQNPVYALSPVTVTEVASSPTAMTYQWQTDGGSWAGLTNILDATNSTLVVVPPDEGAPYTINYACVVANAGGSVSSLTNTLTINAASAPIVTKDTNPKNVFTFVGGKVTFGATFDGTRPITNQWQVDTGSGFTGIGLTATTNQTLVLANIQLTDSGNYQMVATNVVGNLNSTPTTLTVQADPDAPISSQAYAYDVYTNSPLAYWRLSEVVDPTAGTYQAYDASGHGLNATYGSGVTTGVAGPQSPEYVGFETTNTAASFTQSTANGTLVVPPLNVSTTNVTITAWIYPAAYANTYAGLLMNRGASAAGLGFGGNTDTDGSSPTYGQAELGYNWNNNPAAYNFHSGLFAPLFTWSFVALTITPTNATLYLCYANGDGTGKVLKRVNPVANSLEAFNVGTTWLGGDPASVNNIFTGSIDEVAVFSQSLGDAQIQNLFVTGAGAMGSVPSITSDTSCNTATNQYPGQVPLQLTAAGIGLPAPHYQWQAGTGGVFSDLANGGAISGVNSGTLTINQSTTANNLDYQLVLTNVNGSVTSSVYTVSMPIVPNNGIWTARYQLTNATGPFGWGSDGHGSGSFSGSGVLGSGGFWNPIPGGGMWANGTYTSVSDLNDDGSTHSGITCQFTGQSVSAGGATYAANDRHGLLSQFVFYYGSQANAIVFGNVPNGTYNLALHGDDADWNDRGTTFTVHGVNGDQSDTTVNSSQNHYFVAGNTSVLITNVQASGGTLTVDVTPGPTAGGQCALNAVEIQAVAGSLIGNPAHVGSVSLSGGNVVITGTSPDAGQSYRILTSTNLALPLASWAPVATNVFAGAGFSNSIPMNPANPQQFYQVVEP